LLLRKDFFVNISKIRVFAFVFNVYTKYSIINAIKNVKCVSIYINLFITNEDNNDKKKVISFYAIALIINIIKKYKDRILNFVF